MSRPPYPAPDRSNFRPNELVRDPVIPEGDIGARVGELADGRPFRVEAWYSEGATFITCFFSTVDLETAPPELLLEYIRPVLEQSRVPRDQQKLGSDGVRMIDDASGHRMFTLTFVVGLPD